MESSNTARGATDNLIGIGFMLMSVLAGLITATVVKRFLGGIERANGAVGGVFFILCRC